MTLLAVGRRCAEGCECVYEIPCLNCDKSYIGETSRLFRYRLEEHKTEAEKASKKAYTRSQKSSVSGEQNKSAITDHVAEDNHVIGWKQSKIRDRENIRSRRHIKESIWIRSRGAKTLNSDSGNYFLPHIYDQLLTAPSTSDGDIRLKAKTGQRIWGCGKSYHETSNQGTSKHHLTWICLKKFHQSCL